MIHIKNLFTKEFIKEYINRNKNLILISVIIFTVSILLGAIFSNSFESMATELIKQMLKEIPSDSISQNAQSIFINNITASVMILLGGLIFSLISILAILVNGILIGYVYTLINPAVYFVGIVPHGIFELTALILTLTGAFIITKMEIKIIQSLFAKNFKNEIKNMNIYITDLIFTILISFILFLIAAIIEATITPILLNMVI